LLVVVRAASKCIVRHPLSQRSYDDGFEWDGAHPLPVRHAADGAGLSKPSHTGGPARQAHVCCRCMRGFATERWLTPCTPRRAVRAGPAGAAAPVRGGAARARAARAAARQARLGGGRRAGAAPRERDAGAGSCAVSMTAMPDLLVRPASVMAERRGGTCSDATALGEVHGVATCAARARAARRPPATARRMGSCPRRCRSRAARRRRACCRRCRCAHLGSSLGRRGTLALYA